MYQATTASVAQAPAQAVEVWSPKAIAWLTFCFGLLTGLLLASYNWWQLEQRDTARNHIIAAVVVFIVSLASVLLMPGILGSFVALALNLGGMRYLHSRAQAGIDEAAARDVLANYRHAGLGVAIGIVVAVASAILLLALANVVGGAA